MAGGLRGPSLRRHAPHPALFHIILCTSPTILTIFFKNIILFINFFHSSLYTLSMNRSNELKYSMIRLVLPLRYRMTIMAKSKFIVNGIHTFMTILIVSPWNHDTKTQTKLWNVIFCFRSCSKTFHCFYSSGEPRAYIGLPIHWSKIS